jgi:hypothetical protein
VLNAATLGPLLLGASVGWTVYYFMRRFKKANPAVLTATLAAFLGGPALNFLSQLSKSADGAELQSHYFLGLGIGFFSYAGYVGLLVLLSGLGFMDRRNFEFMARCGPAEGDPEFTDLLFTLKDWSQGKMSDEELREAIKEMGLSPQEYQKRKSADMEPDDKALISLFEQRKLAGELLSAPVIQARKGRGSREATVQKS